MDAAPLFQQLPELSHGRPLDDGNVVRRRQVDLDSNPTERRHVECLNERRVGQKVGSHNANTMSRRGQCSDDQITEFFEILVGTIFNPACPDVAHQGLLGKPRFAMELLARSKRPIGREDILQL